MLKNETFAARTWRRLGLTEVWGIPLLWFTIVVTALLSLAFDAARLSNFTIMWLPINSAAFIVGVFIVASGWLIGQRINIAEPYRPIYNIVVAGLAMGSKNAATLYFCKVFGVQDTGEYFFRFLGGVAIGIALLLIYSNLVGARLEDKQIQRELLAKERALLGFRENLGRLFQDEENILREKTAESLLPRFNALVNKTELGADTAELSQSLKSLLSDEVKPLSVELAQQASKLQVTIPESSQIVKPDLNIKVVLADSIRPFASTLLVLICWAGLRPFAMPSASYSDILICSGIYGILMLILKLVTKPLKALNPLLVLLASAFPGLIAGLPAYFLLYQIPHTPIEATLIPTFLAFGGWTSTALGQAYVLELGRSKAEEKLKAVVSRFERENKLFEQRLWVAKHAWYTLLHGSVQSALTAASIRAANTNQLSAKDREAILRDLRRASDSLRNPITEKISLEQSVAALKQAWEGLVTIDFSLKQESLSQRINLSPDSPVVINELLKEAVSNAVRHGEARAVSITLNLVEQDNLEIIVSNNGLKPEASPIGGVGNQIFDTLTISHELSWDPEKQVTQFKATVPLA